MIDTLLFGAFGSLAASFLDVFKFRHENPKKFPSWSKNYTYYILSIVMALFSVGICYAYQASGVTLNLILAMHIGAASPLVLQRMANSEPEMKE